MKKLALILAVSLLFVVSVVFAEEVVIPSVTCNGDTYTDYGVSVFGLTKTSKCIVIPKEGYADKVVVGTDNGKFTVHKNGKIEKSNKYLCPQAFDCSGIPNGQPVFEGDKLVGCIGGDYKYEKPYEALVIIKTEQKSRRHMTDCNHCDMTEGGIYSCTAMMCPVATYHYNEYSIGTSDGKILCTIEDTEKVEE